MIAARGFTMIWLLRLFTALVLRRSNGVFAFSFAVEKASISRWTDPVHCGTRSRISSWSPRRTENRIYCFHGGAMKSPSSATIRGRRLQLALDPDSEEIVRELARAKELIAKSQAALESREKRGDQIGEGRQRKEKAAGAAAVGSSGNGKREMVTKSVGEKSGLITTDGDLMAKLSEEEEWEARALLDVFEDEVEKMFDDDELGFSSTAAAKRLAKRDEAASIYNLRLSMHTPDFDRVFDKRNRFIGEG